MRLKFAFFVLTGMMLFGAVLADVANAEGNMVVFRGGWVGMTSDRGDEIFTDANQLLGLGGARNDGRNGSYVGASLDLLMHKNFLGFKGMSLLGEIGVEYKRLNSEHVNVAVPNVACIAASGSGAGGTPTCPLERGVVNITMLTVDVSPKLKFREGSAFRPWIIPVGLDFHVISPPSNETTVLDIGVQFGAGVEYNFWGPLNLGLDGRFHLAAGETGTTNNFGTLGAYLGIAF